MTMPMVNPGVHGGGVEPSKGLNVALWVVQIVMAAMFLGAAFGKLTGAEAMVAVFEKVGLGQWFRYLTGTLELAGAVLLVVPRTASLGAVVLAVVMVGAIVAHLAVLGGSPLVPLVLLAGALFVAWGRRAQLASWVERLRPAR